MDIKKLNGLGNAGNIILILVNLFAFIFYKAENIMVKGMSSIPGWLIVVELLVRLLVIGAGVIALVMFIICIIKNQRRLKGFGVGIDSAVVTMIFGIIGIMLGIIIWILSGISLSALGKSYKLALQASSFDPNAEYTGYDEVKPESETVNNEENIQ